MTTSGGFIITKKSFNEVIRNRDKEISHG